MTAEERDWVECELGDPEFRKKFLAQLSKQHEHAVRTAVAEQREKDATLCDIRALQYYKRDTPSNPAEVRNSVAENTARELAAAIRAIRAGNPESKERGSSPRLANRDAYGRDIKRGPDDED